jgi:hypothetical protein
MIAQYQRRIKPGNEYNYLFPQPAMGFPMLSKDGDVLQTVRYMISIVEQYAGDTAKLAKKLSCETLDDTCRKIWNFCYEHIQYNQDEPGIEQLRRPARVWADRKTGVDCDCFSIFIGSILYNLKIPFSFRITKYGKPNFQHVYVVVERGGRTIILDPVVDSFDYEKPFSEKKDTPMSALGIPIQFLNGIGSASVQNDIVDLVFDKAMAGFDGLGSVEAQDAAIFEHLIKTREIIAKNPVVVESYQNPAQFKQMLDYAIRYFKTPARNQALAALEEQEDKLIASGGIITDESKGFFSKIANGAWSVDTNTSLSGKEWDKKDAEKAAGKIAGKIENIRRAVRYIIGTDPEKVEKDRKGDFKGVLFAAQQIGPSTEERWTLFQQYARDWNNSTNLKEGAFQYSKIEEMEKNILDAEKKVKRWTTEDIFEKTGQAIVKYNPVSIAVRNGFLAAFKVNMFQFSERLKYAFMTQQEAEEDGLTLDEYNKVKEAYNKVKTLFVDKLQGKEENLREAILSGKRKDLRGFGDPVTIASAGAAGGFLATVGTFLTKLGLNKDIVDKWKKRRLERKAKKALDKGDKDTYDKLMAEANTVTEENSSSADNSDNQNFEAGESNTEKDADAGSNPPPPDSERNILQKIGDQFREHPVRTGLITLGIAEGLNLAFNKGHRRWVARQLGMGKKGPARKQNSAKKTESLKGLKKIELK